MENSLLLNTGPVGDLVAENQPVSLEPNFQAIVTKIYTVMLGGLSLKEESMLDKGNEYCGDEIKMECVLDKYDSK